MEQFLPSRWRRPGYQPVQTTAPVGRLFVAAEERSGMLGTDRIEMSER